MKNDEIFSGHLEPFMAIWYILPMYNIKVILWSFGRFSPLLVYCTNKNLATLVCLFVCQLLFMSVVSVCLFLSFFSVSVVSVCRSVCLFVVSVCCFCLSVCLSVCLFLFCVSLSACLFVCFLCLLFLSVVSVCCFCLLFLSVVSVCLSVCLSVCPFVRSSVWVVCLVRRLSLSVSIVRVVFAQKEDLQQPPPPPAGYTTLLQNR
jgi:hypothetical protein